jgi:hypothetical protein
MAEAKEKTTPIRLLYDMWADEEKRIPAGTVLDVPVATSLLVVQSGTCSTVRRTSSASTRT